MTAACESRRGFALPTVVLVLALLALLATAAIEAARTSRRSSALAQADSQLQAAAEHALGEAAASWPTAISQLAVGARTTMDAAASGEGLASSVTVTRIAPALFWATADARLTPARLAREGGGPGGRRRVNGIFALPALGIATGGALVAGGSVEIRAPATISTEPAGDRCPSLPTDSAMVVVPPGDSVVGGGATWSQRDAAGDPATFDRWGGIDWGALAAGADLDLADGEVATADGACSGAMSAWGSDASSGCSPRYTVVHARGDLTIAGGRGAGVLLVEGRLRITGAFTFTGLVVARGGIDVVADGSVFTGAVLAGRGADAGVPSAILSGVAELRASRCAVWQALAARAGLRRVAGRWWSELL